MLIVDSHCHLNFPDFNDDLEQVIKNAQGQGVGVMQTICTKMSEFDDILKIANDNQNIYCSVGVHPHEAGKSEIVTVDELVKKASNPKVIGIGETGLDYFYEHSPRKEQKISFLRHIEASRITGLPIIIHTRSADDDTMDILEAEMKKGEFTGLIHCFSTSRELAERAIAIGLYISISGIVTFKKSIELQEIVADLPIGKLLVETDAPYLAPMPNRGKRNEPAFTRHTCQFVADIKEILLEECAKATTDNFFNIFNKASYPK